MRFHNIEIAEDRMEAFCRKWKIREISLFGSVLREDFGPDSDVDCLVVFAPEGDWSLLDVIRAERELSALVGRPVDLVDMDAVQNSENWIRRRRILDTAKTIYAR